MKKKKLFAMFLAAALMVTGTACGGGDDADGKAATVLKNGVVYTVEGEDWDKNPQETVAMGADGSILFVGSDADAKAYIGDKTEVIDLKGNVVFPGFIDSHQHAPGTAVTQKYSIYLSEAKTKKDAIQIIQKFVNEYPDEERYFGKGYLQAIGSDPRGPQKEWLDEITDKPMYLTSSDGHVRWLNSAALKECGITAKTKVPEGGGIPLTDNGKEVWGTIADAPSLIPYTPEYTDAQYYEGFKEYQKNNHSWGYTTINAMPAERDAALFKRMEDEGELKLRVNTGVTLAPAEDTAEIDKQIKKTVAKRDSHETELVKYRTGKIFVDGVVEGMTAWLFEPYTKAAGRGDNYTSAPLWDLDVMTYAMTELLKNDFAIHCHSMGDRAIHETLNSIEKAQKANGDKDYRNSITHLQVVASNDIPRFAELGVIASHQVFWHTKAYEWYNLFDEPLLGKKRAEAEYPLNSFLKAGAMISASSDHSVTPVPYPFFAIEAGVTRNMYNLEQCGAFKEIKNMDDYMDEQVLNAGERVTVKDMIQAYTMNNAYQMEREDEIGSLKAGKKADIIVVDSDPFKADPVRIDEVKLLTTYFNGKAVYKAGS